MSVFLLIPPGVRCQIRQHRFERITVDDGLSSYRVYDVAQDSLGFLWVGTLEGLDRYDGHNFVHFRHDEQDSTSLSSDRARTLFVDHQGTLWVGTDAGGLNMFDARTERFRRYVNSPDDPASIGSGKITAISEDASGNLWVGILGGGLDVLGRGSAGILHYRHDESDPRSLGDDRVHALAGGDNGAVWVGTEGGLDRLDRTTGTFTHFRHSPGDPYSLSGSIVTAILCDGPGTLWVGVAGGGLNRFDCATGRCVRYRHLRGDPGSISHDDVSCIYAPDPETLWVGVSDIDGGVNRLDKTTGRFVRFKNDPLDPTSLLHNYVRNIRPGDHGDIWIATDRGLSKLERRSEQFRHYTIDPNILASKTVSSLRESRNGAFLWIGTNGLERIDAATGARRGYRHDPADLRSMHDGYVQGIYEDRAGTLWFGTTSGGLERFDPRTGKCIHIGLGADGHAGFPLTIVENHRGGFWVGTADAGLVRYDPRTGGLTRYAHDPLDPKSLASDAVFALLEDHEGVLWVGTEGGGLDKFDGVGSFGHCRLDTSQSGKPGDSRVYALLEDHKQRIWVGTRSGVSLLDRNSMTCTPVTLSDGRTGMVLGIVEGKHGEIWMSTMLSGVLRFDPDSGTTRSYDALDGLQGNNFSDAACRRSNGEIMLGGENGYNIFDPDSIIDNRRVPPVVLTSFLVFGKPLRAQEALTQLRGLLLRYNQNYFSFEFSALDFTAPAKNRYAYMLEGVDTTWVFPLNRRYASYTNIEPGNYTFRVRASNTDGLWNEAGLALPITITPPFWATWWFRTLALLVAVSVLAGAYQYRVAKLLEMERMRLRIASDLHDDIGSSLSSIALITDMVRRELPPGQKSGERLQDASSAARKTADALRDIVWLINPEHDTMDDLVLRMKDAAAKLLVGIAYRFDCPEGALGSVLNMEFRRHLWLMYKETLHNIAKYSQARRVDIEIRAENRMMRMRVTDDGVGFDTTLPSSGHGLASLRARAAKLGGAIAIASVPGQGTEVLFEAKLP